MRESTIVDVTKCLYNACPPITEIVAEQQSSASSTQMPHNAARTRNMKFFKELPTRPTAEITTDNRPAAHRTAPNVNDPARPEVGNRLATLDVVAQTLHISKRSVQRLVKRKVIPVIRLGKRCLRFDMNRVLAAVKRFEVEEMALR